MTDTDDTRLSIALRITHANDNHHLWNNNGTWWIHFTMRSEHGTVLRHRKFLKTADVEKARAKRDRLLHALIHSSGRIAA